MNKLQYYLLQKHHGNEQINEEYLEELYQYFKQGSEKLEYKIQISKEDFKKMFSIIYDVLILKLNHNQIAKLNDHYLKLIMYDALVEENVDVYWFIKHIWYLNIYELEEKFTFDYKDCISFIQEEMIKEFGIKENIKEKIDRKVYTFILK